MNCYNFTNLLISVAAERENNFIVGLTNMDPSVRAPHPTSYTVGFCGKGPAFTVASQSYWVRCGKNLASARYVVIQVEVQTLLQICELYVYGQPGTKKLFYVQRKRSQLNT